MNQITAVLTIAGVQVVTGGFAANAFSLIVGRGSTAMLKFIH